MNKKCRTAVDVLYSMVVTCPVCHLEMSALNAAAPVNTTHHPKYMYNKQSRSEFKKINKQISDTIHEQKV